MYSNNQDKTVFVIGAGASADLGFPTGNSLKRVLSDNIVKFKMSEKYFQKKDATGFENILNEYLKKNKLTDLYKEFRTAAEHIKENQFSPSIDQFIGAQCDPKIALISKIAIVYCFLTYEKRSILKFMNNDNMGFDLRMYSNTWYYHFFNIISGQKTVDFLDERLKKVSLIVFNYDRCVEHFLFNAFKLFYKLSPEQASIKMKNIEIIHPYGKVGLLPWEYGDEQYTIGFGENRDYKKQLGIVQEIKTFTENHSELDNEQKRLKGIMSSANRVTFLGFGYQQQNLNLLTPPNKKIFSKKKKIECYGTCFEVSETNTDVIKKRISYLFKTDTTRIILKNQKCNEFLKDTNLSLEFKK